MLNKVKLLLNALTSLVFMILIIYFYSNGELLEAIFWGIMMVAFEIAYQTSVIIEPTEIVEKSKGEIE